MADSPRALSKHTPAWARRRFLKKHSGLHRGVFIALPLAVISWVVVWGLLRVI